MEGDAERVALLQEVVGACLCRGLPWQYYALLIGEGSNGKGVFLRMLERLLGAANYSALSLADLGGGDKFALFSLLGKLANIKGDDEAVSLKEEATIKSLTGGDPVKFERKYHNPVFAVNTAKLIVSCNLAPRINDRSNGMARRRIPIPFGVTVPVEKRDPALLTDDCWFDEMPGVLVWALEGLARLRANRCQPTRPKVCVDLLDEQLDDSNPARVFLRDRYVATKKPDDNKLTTTTIYAEYVAWYDAQHRDPAYKLNPESLGQLVRTMFGVKTVPRKVPNPVGHGRTSVRAYIGLRCADAPQGTDDQNDNRTGETG
jgi:putative DNA primase/helicase